MESRAVEATADLLARARAGESRAFDELFARALPRLRWFVELRLGEALRQRLEAQDVVQETYAAAWSLVAGYEDRGEGAFVRWLFQLAENQIRRAARHHGAARRSAVRIAGPADAALALAADPASGPCTRAERLDQRARLARALGTLEGEQREAIVLRILQSRPLAEVAAELGRSETATRRLVARGIEVLGRALGAELDR